MTSSDDSTESDPLFRLSIHSSFEELDPELADDRTPWTKWTEGDLALADLPAEDQATARRLLATSQETMEVVRHLTGAEDEVLFVPGQKFSGVTEEWIRARLRLNPVIQSVDLNSEGLNIELDGELIEDLDQENVFGTGPNDGELAR